MANLARFFDQTRQSSPEYYASIFAQRTKDNAAQGGSFYDASIEQIENTLKNTDWVKSSTYPEKAGRDGSVIKTYRASVGGYFGMIPLSQVADSALPMGFDPKKTGYGSAAVVSHEKRKYFKYSHLVIAVNPDGSGFVLTAFPGPSIAPQEVTNNQIGHGQPVSKEMLQHLGIKWVKLVF
jgi:hypothetical protein